MIFIVIVLCIFLANNGITASDFIPHHQNIKEYQGTSQHFFPSFSYFPFGNDHSFFRPTNHRLLEPILRRHSAKNLRHLFDYRQSLDRSDESSPLDQNSASVSIMRGGTFFDDGQSSEDIRYDTFSINADRDKQEYFSNEAETHSKPVYQQFDKFRDFADITLPTSSQLMYAQISDKNTNFESVNGKQQMMESSLNFMEYLKELKPKTKLESENRKSLIKEMKKKKQILSLAKQLLHNNSSNFEPLLAVN